MQTAASSDQFEAVVKLVEAGASWRPARGQQRNMGGSMNYVPELLSAQKPGLKVGPCFSVIVKLMVWWVRC
jgi:hypothetical protein